SSTDAWAVGAADDENDGRTPLTLAEHWNGLRWSLRMRGLPKEHILYSVSAVGPSDVWAVGDMGVAHWDGVSWTVVHPLSFPPVPYSIAAIASDDVWVVGSAVEHRVRIKTYAEHWD